VEHHAHQARRNLHPGSSYESSFLIVLKSFWKIPIDLIGAGGQAHRVFERHGGALREVLEHEVRGVAQQRDRPLRPVLHRLAEAQHPAPEHLRHAQDAHRLLAVVREERQHFLGRRFLVVP